MPQAHFGIFWQSLPIYQPVDDIFPVYLGCSLILYFFVLADAHVSDFARQPFVASLLFVVMLFAVAVSAGLIRYFFAAHKNSSADNLH